MQLFFLTIAGWKTIGAICGKLRQPESGQRNFISFVLISIKFIIIKLQGVYSMEEILKTIDLSKTFGKGETAVNALLCCNLSIVKGEKLAIMGASGSGKSTLLHLIGALDIPTSGTILFNGDNLCKKTDSELSVFRRRNIGFVFQSFNLVPELTAKENIFLPLFLDNKKVDDKYLKSIIHTLKLEDRLDHYPGELSGGQQQRVAIARAVINKPSLVLCDEPTGNLDSKNSNEVIQLLIHLSNTHGITLVIVTHDPSVAKFADKTIMIMDGKVGGNIIESVNRVNI